MLEFVVIGPGVKQRWRRALSERQPIRIGRDPAQGWAIPWDVRVSREHADIELVGDRLHVRCVKAARNPAHVGDQSVRDFDVGVGEQFRIGSTIFYLDLPKSADEQGRGTVKSEQFYVEPEVVAQKPAPPIIDKSHIQPEDDASRLQEVLERIAEGEPSSPVQSGAEAVLESAAHEQIQAHQEARREAERAAEAARKHTGTIRADVEFLRGEISARAGSEDAEQGEIIEHLRELISRIEQEESQSLQRKESVDRHVAAADAVDEKVDEIHSRMTIDANSLEALEQRPQVDDQLANQEANRKAAELEAAKLRSELQSLRSEMLSMQSKLAEDAQAVHEAREEARVATAERDQLQRQQQQLQQDEAARLEAEQLARQQAELEAQAEKERAELLKSQIELLRARVEEEADSARQAEEQAQQWMAEQRQQLAEEEEERLAAERERREKAEQALQQAEDDAAARRTEADTLKQELAQIETRLSEELAAQQQAVSAAYEIAEQERRRQQTEQERREAEEAARSASQQEAARLKDETDRLRTALVELREQMEVETASLRDVEEKEREALRDQFAAIADEERQRRAAVESQLEAEAEARRVAEAAAFQQRDDAERLQNEIVSLQEQIRSETDAQQAAEARLHELSADAEKRQDEGLARLSEEEQARQQAEETAARHQVEADSLRSQVGELEQQITNLAEAQQQAERQAKEIAEEELRQREEEERRRAQIEQVRRSAEIAAIKELEAKANQRASSWKAQVDQLQERLIEATEAQRMAEEDTARLAVDADEHERQQQARLAAEEAKRKQAEDEAARREAEAAELNAQLELLQQKLQLEADAARQAEERAKEIATREASRVAEEAALLQRLEEDRAKAEEEAQARIANEAERRQQEVVNLRDALDQLQGRFDAESEKQQKAEHRADELRKQVEQEKQQGKQQLSLAEEARRQAEVEATRRVEEADLLRGELTSLQDRISQQSETREREVADLRDAFVADAARQAEEFENQRKEHQERIEAAEAARRQAEAELRQRQSEADSLRQEMEQLRQRLNQEREAQQTAEEAAQRIAEEAYQRAEQESQKSADEAAHRAAEAEARERAEEDAKQQRAEAEQMRAALEDLESELRLQVESNQSIRLEIEERAEAESALRAAEEARRQEEEARRQVEEVARQAAETLATERTAEADALRSEIDDLQDRLQRASQAQLEAEQQSQRIQEEEQSRRTQEASEQRKTEAARQQAEQDSQDRKDEADQLRNQLTAMQQEMQQATEAQEQAEQAAREQADKEAETLREQLSVLQDEMDRSAQAHDAAEKLARERFEEERERLEDEIADKFRQEATELKDQLEQLQSQLQEQTIDQVAVEQSHRDAADELERLQQAERLSEEERSAREAAESEAQELRGQVEALRRQIKAITSQRKALDLSGRKNIPTQTVHVPAGDLPADFDPYHRWLGIPADEQPADHYRLLGLTRFESNEDVIVDAANRQMAHVRNYQVGRHASASQKLLNELAAAKLCLTDAERKARYDKQLQGNLDTHSAEATETTEEHVTVRADGSVFDEYELIDQLSRGGTGQVFKARHRSMGRTVALKILSADAMKSPKLVRRFRRKMQLLARLSHPNLVTAFDAGNRENTYYLIMEYIDGEDLLTRLRRKVNLSIDEIVQFITEAARGLEYAHANRVFHRNIKPNNILVDKQGSAKVIGLGLALLSEDDEEAPDEVVDEGIIGTIDYMAPEQASDSRMADHRSDIYGLGCTLFTLLTKKLMYPVESARRKILAHRHQPIPSIREFRDDVPPQLDDVFQRMVAKLPKDRFQSMSDVVEALQQSIRNSSYADKDQRRVSTDSVGLNQFLDSVSKDKKSK